MASDVLRYKTSFFGRVGIQVWQRAGSDGESRDDYFIRFMRLNDRLEPAESPGDFSSAEASAVVRLIGHAQKRIDKFTHRRCPVLV